MINTNELIESLNELNKYINYGNKEKYIKEESEIKPYEIFVVSEENCLSGYKYMSSEDAKDSSEENKLCFVISEWINKLFNLRYSNKNFTISSINYTNFKTLIDDYKDSLFTYINEIKT